jgi:photosystem II stability/assembly factor-like uncharacterized protein
MMASRHTFRRLARNLLSSTLFPTSLLLVFSFGAPCATCQTWKPLGPAGGDVRALASDPARPNVVYLGTTDGHIFGSEDGGRRWRLLGMVGASRNAIVTSILVDPREPTTLFVSTWTREKLGEGGGIYRSGDGGRSWRASGLAGHSVRALVAAPSDPDILVAGALDGLFRSHDAGKSWELITPANDPELRNFDSLAVDPRNPEIIYAGTFHLPWKTTDGGQDWVAIHDGMIDDSDVLSLAVNPSNPEQIFASACSGIYRSDDAGSHWKRIQGIPDSSKRALVIRFDSANPGTLYAGTTDGLWKSSTGGDRWRRASASDWVINSLLVLPAFGESAPSQVLLGTEQQGVLISEGMSSKFEPANDGFQHRRIVSLTLDRENPGRLGAVLANASDPIVTTDDAGETWLQLGSGLASASVRRLYFTPDGWWVALTSGGFGRLDANSGRWLRAGMLVERGQISRAGVANPAARHIRPAATEFRATVNDLAFSENEWFAATEEGLFRSSDAGKSWSLLLFSSLALPVDCVRVSADGAEMRVVTSRGMLSSSDSGRSWRWHDLPLDSYGALRLEVVDATTLLAASPTGLYISRDGGTTWSKEQSGLPASAINDVLVRPEFWVVSLESNGLYISRDRGANWSRIGNPSGSAHAEYFPVIVAGFAADSIYVASASDSLYLLDLSSPEVLATRLDSGH